MAANTTWLSKPPSTCPVKQTPIEYQAKQSRRVQGAEKEHKAGW